MSDSDMTRAPICRVCVRLSCSLCTELSGFALADWIPRPTRQKPWGGGRAAGLEAAAPRASLASHWQIKRPERSLRDPGATEPAAAEAPSAPLGEALEELAAVPRQAIMVVDDDWPVREAIAEALCDAGYGVTTAPHGEAALLLLGRGPLPDIVIADVNLGQGMDGVQLAAAVNAAWPELGILLISGDTVMDAPTLPDAFLRKPFSTRQLLCCIADMSGRSHPVRASCTN